MSDIALVTDSTAYLPATLIENLGITVVSLYYDIEGHASPQGGHEVPGRGLLETDFDGDFAQFYAQLDASKTVATTSPPTLEDFVTTFTRLFEQHQAVVAILLGSHYSTSCSIAKEAAIQVNSVGRDKQVVVIDSAGTAGHLGIQVLAAARAAAEGKDTSSVIARVRQARQEVRQWILLDTLEYLRRGGRIGTAAAWIGSVLDLKPILMIESEMRAVERVRTHRRGVDRLVELMRQRRSVGADRWFVNHAYAHEEAKLLTERLSEIFGTAPEFVAEVGPVVATHVGPGTLSVGGLPSAALE